MPPINEVADRSLMEAGVNVEARWFAVYVLVVVAVTLLVAVLICACGGKKDEEPRGEGEKQPKAEEKLTKAEGGGKAAAGPGEKQGAGAAYLDLSQPGVPPEEKKRIAPPTKGIAESNPAYQTLMHDSKFEATQAKGLSQTKGLPPPPAVAVVSSKLSKMSTVAGSNPAYQTLVNNSKFEATQAASKAGGGTTMKTASKAGGGTMMKTAVAASQVKTTLM